MSVQMLPHEPSASILGVKGNPIGPFDIHCDRVSLEETVIGAEPPFVKQIISMVVKEESDGKTHHVLQRRLHWNLYLDNVGTPLYGLWGNLH